MPITGNSIGAIASIVAAAPPATLPASLGPTDDGAVLYAAYIDALARHDRLLTLVQQKDWGFARDERTDQLERALKSIFGILADADLSKAEQGAHAILDIIAGVMPGLFPTPT